MKLPLANQRTSLRRPGRLTMALLEVRALSALGESKRLSGDALSHRQPVRSIRGILCAGLAKHHGAGRIPTRTLLHLSARLRGALSDGRSLGGKQSAPDGEVVEKRAGQRKRSGAVCFPRWQQERRRVFVLHLP